MSKQGKTKVNIFLTAVIICISLVAVCIVYVPKFLKLNPYVIETNSMSPTINSGSIVYVQKYSNISDYNIGDIVTFTDSKSGKSFTHRVVAIDDENQTFTTQGDANNTVDPMPTSLDMAVGKVVLTVPYLGKLVVALRYTIAKVMLAVIYVAWAAIEIELYLSERKKRYA